MWFCADDCSLVANNVVSFADNPVSGTLIVSFNVVEKWPMIAVRTPDDCSSQQVRPQFKAASYEELLDLHAAAEQSAKIPGYNAGLGLLRPTYSFNPPPDGQQEYRTLTLLADHPKGRGPIYIY